MPTPQGQLPLTGERTVPGVSRENYWFRRHEVVYRWITAQSLATGTVIEAGCGEGYGADMIRATGTQVIAIDMDDAVIAHVRRTYPKVQTLQANLVDLPLRSGTADTVVCLQVIEHLWNLDEFLAECRRILRPGGRLVVSTPNRITFSPGLGRGEKPTNPFHVEEFDADQLVARLTDANFTSVQMHGLRHAPRLHDTDVVARQVHAVLSDEWTQDLLDLVAGVTVADFGIGAITPDEDLDLIAIARR
ncbi:MAG: class I SAM-dependent methyltransferase [Candidatus Nanopelagicales bacterium]